LREVKTTKLCITTLKSPQNEDLLENNLPKCRWGVDDL